MSKLLDYCSVFSLFYLTSKSYFLTLTFLSDSLLFKNLKKNIAKYGFV